MPFLTPLDVRLVCENETRCIWELLAPLEYEGYGYFVSVPVGFQTDFASIPRDYILWRRFGGRFNMEAVVHDYVYRKDSVPLLTKDEADRLLWQTLMESGTYSRIFCNLVYDGVHLGGDSSYHKLNVGDKL